MSLWAVTDGAAGNTRQAEALTAALAARLQQPWQTVVVVGRYPWRALAPRLLAGAATHFDPHFVARLRSERPRWVVGCGRVAALATRLARQLTAGATASVQILDPRLGGAHWDVRVVPAHDPTRRPVSVVCLGSLHPVDDDWLQAAAAGRPDIAGLPSPRTAILLGGPTTNCRWTLRQLQDWCARLERLQAGRGALMLLASRRTPSDARRWIGQQHDRFALVWRDQTEGDNPYPAVLACSQRLLVSPDSVNMLSEAIATRAEVVLPTVPPARGRLLRFHAALQASQRVVGLDQLSAEPRVMAPVRDLDAVADQVLALLKAGRPG